MSDRLFGKQRDDQFVFSVAKRYQLDFLYRRPTCPIIVVFGAVSERLILTPERVCFLIQALFILKAIYHRRGVPELMQIVNKDFLGKCMCSFTSKTDSADQEIYEYTIITHPVQDTVVLNKK